MQHFPVVCSTLSAAHLGSFIQQQYGLSAPVSCRLLRAAMNHTYLVTDGDNKYVFRLYNLNWRNETQVLEELTLLNLLKSRGIPVSYALPDVSNNLIVAVPAPEGTRLAVLFTYARGEKLLSIADEAHYTIGEVMARMHGVTHNMWLRRPDYTPQTLLIDPFIYCQQYIAVETEEMQFMQQLQQYLLELFAGMKHDEVRHGVVHLDIWFDNLNIYNNKEVTIFDFDFCGNGWLFLDIAYYIMQLYNTERESDIYQRKLGCFLKGYESITVISNEEKRLIPAATIALYQFYLGLQCQRFETWTNIFLNETYMKRYINMVVKKIYNHWVAEGKLKALQMSL
jgi:Ser/Thr protein kinase RdoA (MazF antagonist)